MLYAMHFHENFFDKYQEYLGYIASGYGLLPDGIKP